MTHRLVAERVIGHVLPTRAVVHHRDGDRGNNQPDNLVICEDDAYHNLLHRRMRAYAACGQAEARKCWVCKQWGMDVFDNGSDDCAHQRCRVHHERQRYLKHKHKGS